MRRLARSLAFLVMLLLLPPAFCQSGLPPLPPDPFLDAYSFSDTNWLSDSGYAPIAFTNLVSVPAPYGNALLLDTTNTTPAFLAYNIVETNGQTNLDFPAGALRCVFICDWASADTNQNGAGLGATGYLLAAGDFSSGSPDGLWAIYFDSAGTNIYFGGVSNSASSVFVGASISWQSNSIHFIGIVYDTNTQLYIDGQLAATGGPVTVIPATNVWTNGFYVGSDAAGFGQARGVFLHLQLDNSNLFNELGESYFTNAWANITNGYAAWQGGGSSGPDGSAPVLNPISGSGGCDTGGPVIMTNLDGSIGGGNMALTFDIQGGTSGVFYNLYTTTNLAATSHVWQWTWLGLVLTCNTYELTNQPSSDAFYALEVPTMVEAWGDDSHGQSDVPGVLTNATAVAAGGYFSLALLVNGSVVGWGDNTYGQTNIPSGLEKCQS